MVYIVIFILISVTIIVVLIITDVMIYSNLLLDLFYICFICIAIYITFDLYITHI